jgi:hypothetical protein
LKTKILILLALAVGPAACSAGSDEPAAPTTPAPVTTAATPPPSTSAGPSPVTTVPEPVDPVPTSPPTTVPVPVTTAPPPPPPALPSLPVGPDGVEYIGSGDEQEITGPSLLAVDPSGGFHFHDPAGMSIRSFTASGDGQIDLLALDILSVTALAAGTDHLVVVEIFFMPERNRVHRVGYDGTLIETIEIPDGFRLEDGLSSVLTGSDGEIVIEYEGGQRYAVWKAGEARFDLVDTLTLGDTMITSVDADIEINGVLVTTDLVGSGLGGSRYLGTAADGTVVTVRNDVLQTLPIFRVLTTVEWYTPQGVLLGSARVPTLEDQYISFVPGISLAQDGSVYALVALEDVVKVIGLELRPTRITGFADTT